MLSDVRISEIETVLVNLKQVSHNQFFYSFLAQ